MHAPKTARARARAELTAEILDAAHRQLSSVGPADLSLRAIARDLGMSSSAIYRYFTSRDALLTALIVEAYDAIGLAAEEADAAVERSDIEGRLMATTRAVRHWALSHPHQYALIYGSPVPGYAAPDATIDPAGRVGLVLVGIVQDAAETIGLTPLAGRDRTSADPIIDPNIAEAFAGIDESYVVGGIMAWTALFGTISFEMFGHYANVIVDRDAYFDESMRQAGRLCGLDL